MSRSNPVAAVAFEHPAEPRHAHLQILTDAPTAHAIAWRNSEERRVSEARHHVPVGMAATDPAALIRLMENSWGDGTLTKMLLKQDGTRGAPFSYMFTDADNSPEWLRHTHSKDRDKWAGCKQKWVSEAVRHRGENGWYTSLTTFRGGIRDVNHAKSLCAFWVDGDFDRDEMACLKYLTPEAAARQVDEWCDHIGFDRPDVVMFTGRGIFIAWMFKGVPAYRGVGPDGKKIDGCHGRWKPYQDLLCEIFTGIGSDPRARSCEHVFKLPGTIHAINGNVCTLARVTKSKKHLSSFSTLCNRLKPIAEAMHRDGELRATPLPKHMRPKMPSKSPAVTNLGVQRAIRTGKSDPSLKRNAEGEGVDASASAGLLWPPRLKGLICILDYRTSSGCPLPSSHRDGILFVLANALSWLVPDVWFDEAVALCRHYTNGEWDEAECRHRFAAVWNRVQKHLDGGCTIDPNTGMPCDWRYRMSDETIIALAGITEKEEELDGASALARPHIALAARKRRKKATRQTFARKGRKSTTGLSEADERAKRKEIADANAAKAHELKASGVHKTEIAKILGVKSVRTVEVYLSKPAPVSAPAVMPVMPCITARKEKRPPRQRPETPSTPRVVSLFPTSEPVQQPAPPTATILAMPPAPVRRSKASADPELVRAMEQCETVWLTEKRDREQAITPDDKPFRARWMAIKDGSTVPDIARELHVSRGQVEAWLA